MHTAFLDTLVQVFKKSGDPLTKTAEDFHSSPRKALHLLGFHGN